MFSHWFWKNQNRKRLNRSNHYKTFFISQFIFSITRRMLCKRFLLILHSKSLLPKIPPFTYFSHFCFCRCMCDYSYHTHLWSPLECALLDFAFRKRNEKSSDVNEKKKIQELELQNQKDLIQDLLEEAVLNKMQLRRAREEIVFFKNIYVKMPQKPRSPKSQFHVFRS